jgi:hypothetical protein
VGFIGGTIHQRGEGICFREQLGFWALIVNDHQIERANMYHELKNRNLLRFCKQGNFTSGYTSGGLVKDSIALGFSTHPMDSRDLTRNKLMFVHS